MSCNDRSGIFLRRDIKAVTGDKRIGVFRLRGMTQKRETVLPAVLISLLLRVPFQSKLDKFLD